MSHNKIKKLFNKSVSTIASDISKYSLNPTKDFTREKKLPVDKLITFLVSQGASSTKNELLDFFSMSNDTPTASALNQQRDKLRPEALEAVFNEFNASVSTFRTYSNYRFLAADGSTFSFFSKPKRGIIPLSANTVKTSFGAIASRPVWRCITTPPNTPHFFSCG